MSNESLAPSQTVDSTDLEEIASSGSQIQRALAGLLYGGGYEDPEMSRAFIRCRILLERYNASSVTDPQGRRALLEMLIVSLADDCCIEPPFRCDYGSNISLGRGFYANTSCVFLDCAPITIGDNVFVGPQVGMYTPTHPIDAETRNTHVELALPITIGDDVWIGGNTTICPGVTIGSDVVIGAGSVVTHDIPDHCIAVGSPCRVLRTITDEERATWKRMAQEYIGQMDALGIEKRKRADQAGADFAHEVELIDEQLAAKTKPASASAENPTRAQTIPMRRTRQELPREEVASLLVAHGATSGTLALNDPVAGVPYQVPISYVYEPATDAAPLGTFYFHGALKGHKIELIRQGAQEGTNRASFCVTFADDVVPENYSTRYRSAVATGCIEEVEDEQERQVALMELGLAYAATLANPRGATQEEIDKFGPATCVLALRVETLVGKEAKSLAEERNGATTSPAAAI